MDFGNQQNSTHTTMENLTSPLVPEETWEDIHELHEPILNSLLLTINSTTLVLACFHLFFLHAMPKSKSHKNVLVYLYLLTIIEGLLSAYRVALSNITTQHYMLTPKGRWLCEVSGMYNHGLTVCISLILLLVSIDRLLAVQKAYDYQNLLFVRKFKAVSLAFIALSCLLFIAIGLWRRKHFEVKGSGGCKEQFSGIIAAILGFAQLTVIIALYIKILVLNQRRITTTRTISSSKGQDKVLLTVGLIIGAKILFWLPLIFTHILRVSGVACKTCEWLGLISLSLNATANLLLYGITNRAYRDSVRRRLRCVFKTSSPTSVNHTSHTS